jgi:predicted RNase H-like HicB family nuclease
MGVLRPPSVSQGATWQEAVRNAEEAIAAYVESPNERGEPVPPAIDE